MTLEVIGAGFGRTGTMSTKVALELLGFGPCHHMHDVFSDSDQIAFWDKAADGENVDWSQALNGFRAAVDWPTTHYWRQLLEEYPRSKVLLTVRPAEDWWLSFSRTIKQLLESRHEIEDELPRRALRMANKIIAEQTFGGDMSDKDAAISAYRKRIEEVRQIVPTEALLEFDVKQGWQPLCNFLEIEVPAVEFPRINDEPEFWRTFGGQ